MFMGIQLLIEGGKKKPTFNKHPSFTTYFINDHVLNPHNNPVRYILSQSSKARANANHLTHHMDLGF